MEANPIPSEPEHPVEAPQLVNLSETTVAKDGNVFAVTLPDGSLPIGEDHPLGVYSDDCRVLSGHELRIGGARPLLLVRSESSGASVVHELTNPPLELDGGRTLPLQTLRVRLERTLDGAGAHGRADHRALLRARAGGGGARDRRRRGPRADAGHPRDRAARAQPGSGRTRRERHPVRAHRPRRRRPLVDGHGRPRPGAGRPRCASRCTSSPAATPALDADVRVRHRARDRRRAADARPGHDRAGARSTTS